MLQVPILIIIFLTGLATGSFLNCLIYRLEKNQSPFLGRSHCPHCRHSLCWKDLIPLLSFILLKGKCRYCQKKISWQYPLVELVTGILFVLILNYELRIMNYEFFNLENILNSLFLILTSCFLIVIFVYDLKHYIIPDKIIFPAILTAFLIQILRIFNHWPQVLNFSELINPLLSGLLSSAFFLIIFLISRGQWMGFGDVKLAFFMGLFLAFPNILVALFSAFFIGAIIGVGLILIKKRTLKSEIPFGPFLVTGTFIGLFLGRQIISFYLQFLNNPLF